MAKLRYYDAADKAPAATPKATAHTEFLRTGRIDRRRWLPDERQYLSYAEVAQQTARKLTTAGETTHRRINGFHASIRFPKMVFHRTLASSPHLGYCHVTAAKTRLAEHHEITWSFYFANFFCDLGTRRISSTGSSRAIRACFSRSQSSPMPARSGSSSIAMCAATV